MAASDKIQPVEGVVKQNHLHCPVCTKHFTEPKTLDCLHSFCLECLLMLRAGEDAETTRLSCPLCRCTTLSETGVAGLSDNVTLTALVMEAKLQERLQRGQGSEIKCQACDDGNQAISRCSDCDHFLCQECQTAHQDLVTIQSHKIYTLAQQRSGKMAGRTEETDAQKCREHGDETLCCYCNTCQKLVCTTCITLDHPIPRHSLVGLSEAFDQCKRDIAALVTKAEKSRADLVNTMKETAASRKKLDLGYAITTEKITKRANEEIARIREEELQMKHEAERIYKDKLTTLKISKASKKRGNRQK